MMKLVDEGYIFNAEGGVFPSATEDTENSENANGLPVSSSVNSVISVACSSPRPRRACTFTSLCKLSSRKILASFRLGSTKDSSDANGVVMESSDNGETWQMIRDGFQSTFDGRPGEIRSVELAEIGPGKLMAFLTWFDRSGGDGSLYSEQSDSLVPSRLIVAHSRDGGRTWGDYRVIDTAPYEGCSATGPIIGLPNGTWLLAFESFGKREQALPTDGGQARPTLHGALAVTTADGRSFNPPSTIAEDPQQRKYFWDQRLAYCPRRRRMVGMFWTYDRQAESDLPIHIAWGGPDGKSWDVPRSTGISGQIVQPVLLGDGRLPARRPAGGLAFYVHRNPPGSMRLVASEDDGETWDVSGELVVYRSPLARERGTDGEHDFGDYWEDMGTWTFGHPACVQLDDSRLLLAYYAGESADRLSIRWARVAV